MVYHTVKTGKVIDRDEDADARMLIGGVPFLTPAIEARLDVILNFATPPKAAILNAPQIETTIMDAVGPTDDDLARIESE